MTTVLVTGGTGVIGSWAVRAIVRSGGTAVCVSRGQSRIRTEVLGDTAPDARWIVGDINNTEFIEDTIRQVRPDVVAHLASAKPWQMDVGMVDDPDPLLGVRSIIDVTAATLELARKYEVPRVVFGSSRAAYGPVTGEYGFPTYKPMPETYRGKPISVYGITKLAAEQLGEYYHRFLGVEFAALRFASTYGPFKRGSQGSPQALISDSVAHKPNSYTFTETEYGRELHDLIYNDDAGRSVWQACVAPRLSTTVFNIASGNALTIERLAATLRTLDDVVVPDIRVVADPAEPAGEDFGPEEKAKCLLDTTAASTELDFAARFDVRAGVIDMRRRVAERLNSEAGAGGAAR